MKLATPALLTVLMLFVLVSPAFGAEATVQEKYQARAFFLFITFAPALFMLMALPVALVCRASTNFPARVAATLTEKPGAASLLGAANLMLMAILGWAGEQVAIIGIIGAVFLLALAIAVFLGFTSVAQLLGRRLFSGGPRGDSVGAFALGWLVLSGITLLPIVGFLLHLWFAAKGVGAVVLSLGSGKGAQEPAQ
jgi:hypothetical protein